MIKTALIAAILALLAPWQAASGKNTDNNRLLAPVEPAEPRIDVPSAREKNEVQPATVSFGDGSTEKGTISLPGGAITFMEPGTREPVTIPVRDVALVEIVTWKGHEYRKFSYVFNPLEYRIVLRDGTERLVRRDIQGLFKLRFTGSDGTERVLFTYFYDYWKDGGWQNAGSTDFRHHEKNPHPETVVRIRFDRGSPAASPGDILRMILER